MFVSVANSFVANREDSKQSYELPRHGPVQARSGRIASPAVTPAGRATRSLNPQPKLGKSSSDTSIPRFIKPNPEVKESRSSETTILTHIGKTRPRSASDPALAPDDLSLRDMLGMIVCVLRF